MTAVVPLLRTFQNPHDSNLYKCEDNDNKGTDFVYRLEQIWMWSKVISLISSYLHYLHLPSAQVMTNDRVQYLPNTWS